MKRVPFVALAALLTGCAGLFTSNNGFFDYKTGIRHHSKIITAVISYVDRDALMLDKRAILVPQNDTILVQWDLRRIEYERMITQMLAARGYTFVSSAAEAELVIAYDLWISDPQTQHYNVDVPLYGDTGVSSSTTTTKKNIRGELVTETNYTHSRGIVGYNTEMRTDIAFIRHLNMAAYDRAFFEQNGRHRMVWLVECNSRGSSSDLRSVLPFMLVAASDYVDVSSYREVTVTIGNEPADERVKKLRGY